MLELLDSIIQYETMPDTIFKMVPRLSLGGKTFDGAFRIF